VKHAIVGVKEVVATAEDEDAAAAAVGHIWGMRLL
jgi:hypothetical protein